MTEDEFLKFISQMEDEEKLFWEKEYPKMTREGRVKHWSSSLFRSMRSQVEAGQSAYSIYKKEWLEEVLKVEPKFIEFLPDIFRIWGGMWDHIKIEKRIFKLYYIIQGDTK